MSRHCERDHKKDEIKMRTKFLFLFLLTYSCSPRPTIYVKNKLLIKKGEKIAILPFTNLTDTPGAGEKLSNLFLVEILRRGRISVVDPGIVESFLSKERIRLLDRLPPQSIEKIGSSLEVRYIVVGTVLEYHSLRVGKYEIPYIALTLRVIDTEKGEIVFAASHTLSGRDRETIFGIGRITSLEKLSKIMAEEIASSLSKVIKLKS